MYSASVNNIKYEILPEENGFKVNNKLIQWHLVKVSEGYFHIVYQQKSFTGEVVKIDMSAKSFHIKINGKTYPVLLKDKFDLLLEKMGMNNNASSKAMIIKAPMPG